MNIVKQNRLRNQIEDHAAILKYEKTLRATE